MDIITATIVAEHKQFMARCRPVAAWAKPHHLTPAEVQARRESLATADELAAMSDLPIIISKGELFTEEIRQ